MIFAFTISLGSIVGVLALAAIGGGTAAVLRVNILKTTADLYREDNEALRTRMGTMEEDSKIKERELAAGQASLVEKDREAALLRDMVTGTSSIDRLADNMAGHFAIMESLLRLVVGEDVYRTAAQKRDEARERERRSHGGGTRRDDRDGV